jgi:myosin heavy subunit
MKELPLSKKKKVIARFLMGDTYDEIALELGIAKGSVVNIIDDFRSGDLPIVPNEYIDALRELAVDIKKQNTTVKKLKMYVAIDKKLVEMGVGTDQVDDWLDIVQDIATESIAMKPIVSAAIEMGQMEMETGLNCANLVAEYKHASQALKNLKADMSNTIELKKKADTELDAVNKAKAAAQEEYDKQKNELKEKLDQYVVESELDWNMVTTVKAILDKELTKKELGEAEKEEISKKIAEVGSLTSYIKSTKKEKNGLEEHMVGLKEDAHNMEMSNNGLQKHNDQLASHVYAMMEKKKTVDTQIKKIDWQLKELKTIKAGHATDIYTAWLVMAFLNKPESVSNSDFDWLVEILNGIRMARTGKGPKKAVDAQGNVICQCQVPIPHEPLENYGVKMDKARTRLAEYLVPLVKNKFVPKFEYEANKILQEITDMNKQLTGAMFGEPGKSDQHELSGQEMATEKKGPDVKSDDQASINKPLEKQPITGFEFYYNPEPAKDKTEMEKEFAKKVGPRIKSPVPLENSQ